MSILRLWPREFDNDDLWPSWPVDPWFQWSRGRGHRRRQPEEERWSQAVDMRGFNSEDVNVKMEGNNVIVHGKHEFKDGDNIEKMERRRKVALPENVDPENVTTSLNRHGQLIIQAPLKTAPRQQDLAEGFFGNQDIFGSFPRGFQQEGDQVKLRMDLSAYKPDEIAVKVDNHHLKVHAKHEDEHSFRESRQNVLLPRGMDESALKSSLSPDGVLTFSAPAIAALPESGRSLAIEQEEPMAVESGSKK